MLKLLLSLFDEQSVVRDYHLKAKFANIPKQGWIPKNNIYYIAKLKWRNCASHFENRVQPLGEDHRLAQLDMYYLTSMQYIVHVYRLKQYLYM